MTPDTLADTALPPVPLTVEGASVLHQMMRFRRPAWRALSDAARAEILAEASAALAALEAPAEGRQTAFFSLLGHKGDLMFVHFRRSFEELNQAQLELARLALSDYLEPTDFVPFDRRAGPLRIHLEGLCGPASTGDPAAFGRVEAGNRSHARPPAPGHGAATLAGNSGGQIPLLLPDGPAPRRSPTTGIRNRWPTASA